MQEISHEVKRACIRRLTALEEVRGKGWESHWRDIARNFLPRRSRFLNRGNRTNEGEERNFLADGSGILALRTLASGMQSGLTSPARPWFALTLADKELAKERGVKLWLEDTQEKMQAVFRRSNFYDQAHILYTELGAFGTGLMVIEEDAATVARFRTHTAGEYCLDVDATMRVNTVYRRIAMTPRQVVDAWPETAPQAVRDMAERHSTTYLTILHAVEPNPKAATGSVRKGERAYRSLYLILEGATQDVLEDSGFYEFPAIAPRWLITGSDVYGSSPGMDALGDCRQLQKITEDTTLALEKEVNPPLVASESFMEESLDVSAGAINLVATLTQGQDLVRPLYAVQANLPGAERTKLDLREQIARHFHNDLFLMLAATDKQMTAREVAERNAEKMLMLGPVLDRLRSEFFQPLIERVFGIMNRRGLVAEPPKSLAGQEVEVEFISILAQAQKQAGVGAVNQVLAFAGSLAGMDPEILDKIDFDATLDVFADMTGAPPSMLRGEEDVAALREARQQQQQQAQMMAMVKEGATIAKDGGAAAKELMAMQNQGEGF